MITFTSFSEFNKAEGGDIWLAIDERHPLACITGIWTNWTPARKAKEGETFYQRFVGKDALCSRGSATEYALGPATGPRGFHCSRS